MVANGGVRVGSTQRQLSSGVGVPSVLGSVQPGSWVAYADYAERDALGREYRRRIGYSWVRTDPSSPVLRACIADGDTGQLLEGVDLYVRIERPSVEEVNIHGDPTGRSPTAIEWYSFDLDRSESGGTVSWRHVEVYVVPVDFVVELSVRPSLDLNVGDFQSVDLWLVVDTTVWLNAFTKSQYELLRSRPPSGVSLSSYSFRGGFPVWAWVGGWEPWQVSGRDMNPDKWYDPSDLTSGERSELQQHLQIMPSYSGCEAALYVRPGYEYTRLYSSDYIRDPGRLGEILAGMLPGLPDPRFASTVYLHVTLINYGAMKREWGWGPWYGHREFYPSSYLRIRILYAIYGEWVYLWSRSEAERQGYRWENATSTITGERSLWDRLVGGLAGWLSSPWTQLWAALGLATVILIAVAVVIVVIVVFGRGGG